MNVKHIKTTGSLKTPHKDRQNLRSPKNLDLFEFVKRENIKRDVHNNILCNIKIY